MQIFTLWLGLRNEMLILMKIQNFFHHCLLTFYTFNFYTCNLHSNPYADEISALARRVTPPSLVYGH